MIIIAIQLMILIITYIIKMLLIKLVLILRITHY